MGSELSDLRFLPFRVSDLTRSETGLRPDSVQDLEDSGRNRPGLSLRCGRIVDSEGYGSQIWDLRSQI